jgi:hypothetical protein
VLGPSHRQRNIEQRFSFQFTSIDAISHHFGKFTIKISIKLGIALVFLPGDDNMFLIIIAFADGIIVQTWVLDSVNFVSNR